MGGKKAKNKVSWLEVLFWKTQISLLRACPPLNGLLYKIPSRGTASRSGWVKSFFWLAAKLPQVIAANCRDLLKKRVVLPRIVIGVTLRCTLNCEKCLTRLPDLQKLKGIEFPIDELICDLEKLFSCLDYVYAVNLSGGEPFLHPALNQLIRFCADSGKVGALSVVSNGTVIPDDKVFDALKAANATVWISGYRPTLQPNVEQLKRRLDEYQIAYRHSMADHWIDTGKIYSPVGDGLEKQRFRMCIGQLELPYLNGKLYRCSETALLREEEYLTGYADDFIDVRAVSSEAFGGQLKKLVRKRYVAACSYCNGMTCRSPKIPVAVQRESKE